MAGPNIATEVDEQGRLKKLKNVTTSTDIISATTYNAQGELLTMTGVNGAPSEARTYNSIGQMTQLNSGSNSIFYSYSSTNNNGKIVGEHDWVSGETVTYTYDALNRLASATSSTPNWGQSFGYDGFGNLTNVNVTKGSAPSLSVSYNASTNRRTTDSADANGNIFANGVTDYDVQNRITAANISGGTARYSYGPGNKRVWRGTWVSGSQTVDELTFYSAGGAKLCAYNLSTSGGNLVATGTGYYEYFGGKLIKNSTGYVNSDRLGSIGKFYPYGQERPSATSNGKEKYATYFRDSETGLDYAQNRYHSAGEGRFLTTDPYAGSAKPMDPSSWNRYTYTGGDPVNRYDPGGRDWACVGYFGSLSYCEFFSGIRGPHGLTFEGSGVGMSNCRNNFIDAGDYVFANCFAYSWDDACANFGHCKPPCPGGEELFSYGCDRPLSDRAAEIRRLIRQNNPAGFVNAYGGFVAAAGGTTAGAAALVASLAPSATVVLGNSGLYLEMAESIGADAFSVSESLWEDLLFEERWALNQAFIDSSIQRGANVVFSNSPFAEEVGYFFNLEIQYLRGAGYTIYEWGAVAPGGL